MGEVKKRYRLEFTKSDVSPTLDEVQHAARIMGLKVRRYALLDPADSEVSPRSQRMAFVLEDYKGILAEMGEDPRPQGGYPSGYSPEEEDRINEMEMWGPSGRPGR